MSKKVLFIDRDGTIILEPADEQIDAFEKLRFYPGVIKNLAFIASNLDYELVMVSNQDGLGTDSFPEETFWPTHNLILDILKSEGIEFSEILIDKSLPADNAPTRKPRTGMMTAYLEGDYDLANSFVIGDRATDVELAKNMGTGSIFIGDQNDEASLSTKSWDEIYTFLKKSLRKTTITRKTSETDINIDLVLDGTGIGRMDTGIDFFDHMLEQISKHASLDLSVIVKGDLNIDEHHTIEDTAIALGEAFAKALGNKMGIQRYGYCLPMDDCLAQVAIDFGGRNWLEWDAEFKREMIGKMPTEMFFHFFKSFTDGAKCNLNIKAEGENEHHKIEAIFKALAKAIGMAVAQTGKDQIPSTKGVL
ncbi:MAG: bifunctional histidinol-phosphatase/imidazoleglycerol-phosphate dehydratase HisB [Flavobacteriales bacterium]|nr:bifunctional histidinol-phosphatase/imidazoleglycerol-phosphate dehydratase HisB [Flavobacteriales bacterium]